jgi:hypothetical protein
MSNILHFPIPRNTGAREPLVRDLSQEDRMVSQGSNAIGSLMLSLEDDNINLSNRAVQRDVEVIRNMIMGMIERDNGVETWRTRLLDHVHRQID